jgi:hypothetical protein
MPLSGPAVSNIVPMQYAVPTTGQTVAMSANIGRLVLNPAGLLALLTITMPPSPTDGQECSFSTSQPITALTMSGGTIIGGLTTLALGGFASFVYSSGASSWFRAG